MADGHGNLYNAETKIWINISLLLSFFVFHLTILDWIIWNKQPVKHTTHLNGLADIKLGTSDEKGTHFPKIQIGFNQFICENMNI